MSHLPLRQPDDDLIPLLRRASSEDLGVLVEYIHRDRNEELSSVPEFIAQNPRANEYIYDGDHQSYADEISSEIQRYSGNTFSNIFRGGKGIPYIEALQDVAGALKVRYKKGANAAHIEHEIQQKILERAYERMPKEDREKLLKELGVPRISGTVSKKTMTLAGTQAAVGMAGIEASKMAVIIANSVSKALLGRGLSIAASSTITRSIGIFAGPVGWAFTAGLAAYQLGGPAHRVLVPSIVQIAFIRQKICTCSNCDEIQPATANYCQTCGGPLNGYLEEEEAVRRIPRQSSKDRRS